jgi:hypothetical protein
MLLGGVFRGYRLDHSLWGDELVTSWVVASDVGNLSERARCANGSPLYYGMAWGSTWLVGLSEVGLRLPSWFAGVALIPLVYVILSRWTGSSLAALAGAALVAIDPFFVGTSQDARPYSLVVLIGLLQAALCYETIHAANWTKRLALVICTVVLFYLHFLALLLVVGEIAFYVILMVRGRGVAGYPLRWVFVDGLLIALLCLPGALRSLDLARSRGSTLALFISAKVTPDDLLTIFSLSVYIVIPGVLALLIDYMLGSGRPPKPLSPERMQVGVFLCCWYLFPLALAWFLTRSNVFPIFIHRYVITCAVVPIFGAALLLTFFRSVSARTVFLLLIVLAGQWEGPLRFFRDRHLFSGHYFEDWRAAVGHIASADRAGEDAVFVRSGLIESDRLPGDTRPMLRSFCLSPVNNLYDLSGLHRELVPLPYEAQPLDEHGLSQIQKSKRAWIMTRGSKELLQKIVHETTTLLVQKGTKVSDPDFRSFKAVHVACIEVH